MPRNGKALLGHIFPCVNIHHTRHFFGNVGANALHNGVGVGAAQQLDHQRAAAAHDIIGVNALAEQKLHGVFFAHRLAHGAEVGWLAHAFSSFLAFRVFKKLRMPRSWPS